MVRIPTPGQLAALALVVLLAGCAWPHGRREPASVAKTAHSYPTTAGNLDESAPGPAAVMLVSQTTYEDGDLFSGQEELSVEQTVAEVQLRNPSLQAVSDAWRAATERYPQVMSLDDPMFTWMVGPSGVGTMDSGGWMVQASQRIPWTGKRALRAASQRPRPM